MKRNENQMKQQNQSTDLTFTIPECITALPDLDLMERATLARIKNFPGSSNRGLAKLTGLTPRGVEAMLARLRKRGLLAVCGKGRARRHKLLFHTEPHTKCGKNEVVKSHKKCDSRVAGASPTGGSCKPQEPIGDFVTNHLRIYEFNYEAGRYEFARMHLELVRKRLEQEPDVPAEVCAKFLRDITEAENCCFAYAEGAKLAAELPDAKQEALAKMLCTASPDQLATFRERVEAGQLGWNAIKLLT